MLYPAYKVFSTTVVKLRNLLKYIPSLSPSCSSSPFLRKYHGRILECVCKKYSMYFVYNKQSFLMDDYTILRCEILRANENFTKHLLSFYRR